MLVRKDAPYQLLLVTDLQSQLVVEEAEGAQDLLSGQPNVQPEVIPTTTLEGVAGEESAAVSTGGKGGSDTRSGMEVLAAKVPQDPVEEEYSAVSHSC